jgi:virginiamycin B lyase
MIMRAAHRLIASAAIAVLLAACGGGGGGAHSAAVVPGSGPTASAGANGQTVQVTFHIVVPPATSAHTRRAQYISAGTATASIKVNGGAAQTGACTSITCNVTVDAPVGADTFVVQLLDGSLQVLSQGSAAQAISGTIANTVNIAFGGVPKTAVITTAQANFAPGTLAQSSAITVTVQDAAGDTIVGTDTFVDAAGNPLPITLTKSDVSANTNFSTTSFSTPAVAPIFNYNGAAGLAGTVVTISGNATGVAVTPTSINVYAHHAFVEYASSAGPDCITLGPDGNIWFGEEGGNKVGMVTPYGVVTEFSPLTNSLVTGITAGPDGNLWFTQQVANHIGRINPGTHVFADFSGADGPNGITTGSDGALWVADFSADDGTIGRITTAGAISSFPGFTGSSQNEGVALGPDNRIWYTAPFPLVNQVGAITTGGVVTGYPIGIGSQGRGIVAGPDGNMWFTDDGLQVLSRIATNGTGYTTFAPPTGGSAPEGITVGSDNNLWFTEGNVSNIARSTTAGVITEFAVPTGGSFPDAIVNGPDGNLWFTEESGNKIGRFIL